MGEIGGNSFISDSVFGWLHELTNILKIGKIFFGYMLSITANDVPMILKASQVHTTTGGLQEAFHGTFYQWTSCILILRDEDMCQKHTRICHDICELPSSTFSELWWTVKCQRSGGCGWSVIRMWKTAYLPPGADESSRRELLLLLAHQVTVPQLTPFSAKWTHKCYQPSHQV